MAAPKFYPALIDIMEVDALPDALGPIKDGLVALFTNIYFKNLQFDKSRLGDSGFVSIEIVSLAGLNITLPGGDPDFMIRFNPSQNGGLTSETPITLSWEWKLIRFVRGIAEDGFAETATEFFDIIPRLTGYGESELMTLAVAVFEGMLPISSHVSGEGMTVAHVDGLISKINVKYSLSGANAIPAATGTTAAQALGTLLTQIYTDPHKTALGDRSVVQIIFDVYLSHADANVVKNNIKQMFLSLADDILQFVLDLLLPKITASVSLEVGLQFPRSVLIPLDGSGNELATGNSMIMAGPGIFSFSTETGISHSKDISVWLNHQSKIPKTGFTIDFSGVKFDLNENTNIPEATADGRPNAFKGVYIEEIAIGLPKGWVKEGTQTASIKGSKMLIGSHGGLSGEIFLDGGPLETKMGDIGLRLNELGIEFFHNEVIGFNAEAAINIPGLELANGDPAWITLSVDYDSDDGLYTFEGSNFPVLKLFGFGIEFTSLVFEFDNSGLQNFTIAANLYIDGVTDGANPVPIAILISKTGNVLTAGLAPGSSYLTLKLFGIDFGFTNLEFTIDLDTKQLTAFDIEGTIKIKELKNAAGTAPAEIAVNIGYATSPQRLFQLSASGFPPAKLGDFDVTINSFGFEFADGDLGNFDFSGTVKHPELKDPAGNPQPLTFTAGFDNDPWEMELAVTAPANGVTIKDLPFAFNGFSIKFDQTQVLEVEIAGTITIKSINDKNTGLPATIQVTLKVNGNDIHIAGAATGVVLAIPNILEFTPTALQIGRESGDWYFGMNGSLARLFDVPVVGKFIPKKVTADQFLIKQGQPPEFDLTFEWEDGVKVSGTDDGGLEFIIPVDKTFFGSLTLGSIGLKLKPGTPDGLETEIRLFNASLKLGPFTGMVDGLGLSFDVSFPNSPQTGNFGPVDIQIGVIPPTGIGFSLDAGPVKGGGYLSFDHDAGRYAGALELDFAGIFGFTAIGIVTTKMPDGSKGFSLLLLINVTFGTPIALGFNFFLAGVGGLIGLHRTIDTNAVRLGVKDGSIANILFPENVIANISKIISDLEAIFPMKRDQFFLGLMARITWNTPAILTLEVGLIIEFPSPVKLAIIGVIKCILPNPDKAILRLNVAFAGIIDFDRKLISFDASIYDSKILTIGLEGDMALRISWGDKPDFLISVGGFHPAYTPPSHLDLLPMKRMTVSIFSGNPNLVLTTYFALTSNTIQIGAAIDFSFKISKFGVYGYFGFDVLIQFSPFRFMAGIGASVAVKWGSTTLMSISLSFNLEGPAPWRAHGYAKFKILFFSFKVKFDKTWGEKKVNTLPSTEVLPLLLEELNKDENWNTQTSGNEVELVTLSQASTAAGQVLVRPVGSIVVNQNVVPMDLTMEKFGNFQPIDINHVTIDKLTVSGTDYSGNALSDLKNSFAPAAFKNMGDSDKLKAPSYEDQNSGTRLDTTDDLKFDYGINRVVQYEMILSDVAEQRFLPTSVEEQFFHPFVKGGDIGKSELSKLKKAKMKNSALKVSLGNEGYAVALVEDMSNASTGSMVFDSRSEADEQLRKMLKNDPGLENKIQLTPAYQLV